MNEENWVETTKMRKDRKWKDKQENWRTGKRLLNSKCRREKRMKSSNKRKGGNWQKKLRKSGMIGVIQIQSGRGEEESRGKRKELLEKRKRGRKIAEQVMINSNLGKLMNEKSGLKQQERKRIWKKKKKNRYTRNLKNRNKDHRSWNGGDDRWEIKKIRKEKKTEKDTKQKEKKKQQEKKRRGKGGRGSWGKRWKIILPIMKKQNIWKDKINWELNGVRKKEMGKGLRNWNRAWCNKHQKALHNSVNLNFKPFTFVIKY